MNYVYENDRSGLGRAAGEAVRILQAEMPAPSPLDQYRRLAELGSRSHVRAARPDSLLGRLQERARSWILGRHILYEEELLHYLRTRNNSAAAAAHREEREGLLYMTHFDLFSFNGGAMRVWGLAGALSRRFDVTLISIVGAGREADVLHLSPHLRVHVLPVTPAFVNRVGGLAREVGEAAHSLAFVEGAGDIPGLTYTLKRLGERSRYVVLNQPYTVAAVTEAAPGASLVYDVPEINAFFIRRLVGHAPGMERARAMQRQVEKAACERAAQVNLVSEHDRSELAQQVGEMVESKTVLVPNGINVGTALFVPPSRAAELRRCCGLDQPVAIFIGTPHYPPNLVAVRRIAESAARLPDRLFVIVGMRSTEAELSPLSRNLVFAGRVSEQEKTALLALSDLALAPMEYDSGSSLKLPDYLAHGKVVLSTEHGLRGFPSLEAHVTLSAFETFPEQLAELDRRVQEDAAGFDVPAGKAREAVREAVDWDVVGDRMMAGPAFAS